MNRLSLAGFWLRGLLVVSLLTVIAAMAQSQGAPEGDQGVLHAPMKFPLTSVRLPEIVNGAMGVDFDPYFHNSVLPSVRRNWHSIVRQKGISPPTARKIVVEFTILKNGTIDGLKLAEGSDDPETDQAALDAITNSAPFDALPAEFKGESLTLRCHMDVFFPFYANNITPPQLLHPHADAEYSDEARRKHVEGTVLLSLLVTTEGKPTDIKVTRSLGSGLDEKAVEAVSQWRFHPAMKDGKPIENTISVEVSFHLYK